MIVDDAMLYSTNHNSLFDGWTIASFILAIVGGVLTLLLFLKKSNRDKYNSKLKLLYDFLNFDYLSLELVTKYLYATISIFIILSSFSYIGTSFLTFVLYLLIGLIVTRVSFEFFMTVIKLCNNVSKIKDNLVKQDKEEDKKKK